jgi:hypothetical protein
MFKERLHEVPKHLNEPYYTPEERIFLLENSGFNIAAQTKPLAESSKPKEQYYWEVEDFITKSTEDLRAFHYEYLARKPILAHNYKIKKINGSQRVVSEKYLDTPLDDVTSTAEREGALKEGIDTLVANLPKAPNRSMFILTSPNGWSGLASPDGNEYVYPESQTYAYIKQGDEIIAITIRSDMDLSEHEKLLGIESDENLSTKERIKQTISTVRYIPPGKEASFESLTQAIANTMDSQTLWIDGNKVHTAQDMEAEIANKDTQELLEQDLDEIIAGFAEFVRANIHDNNPETIKKLNIALGKTIIEISNKHRQAPNIETQRINSPIDYIAEASFIAEQTGCTAFETSTASVLDSPFGPRSVVKTKIENGKKYFYVEKCGTKWCKKEYKKYLPAGFKCPSCKEVFRGC